MALQLYKPEPTVTYHVCVSPVGWSDPHAVRAYARTIEGGRAHRSLATALKADDKIQRQCRRTNGSNTWIPTRILASHDGGTIFRDLTEAEVDQLHALA